MSRLLCRMDYSGVSCRDSHSRDHIIFVDDDGHAVTMLNHVGPAWAAWLRGPMDKEIREAFESTPPVTP